MTRVMAVTGAYHPEISAAGVQVRAAAAALRGRVAFSVLTTAVQPSLPPVEVIDGVTVYRVHIDVSRRISKAAAALQMARHLLRARRTYDIIHVHGFSQKNVPVAVAARVLGKPLVMTLHTSGQDEPDSVRQRGALPYWAFRSPDLVMSVSDGLVEQWRKAGLPQDRLRVVPNGIDTARFAPASEGERRAVRSALGWSDDERIVLFVGFFSRDKRPDLLFRAWRRLHAEGMRTKLAFVGATNSPYYEIDASLAASMRRDAEEAGVTSDVIFVPPTPDVDRYLRAADVYVLPSIREAHPLALLEAMASGLPCIASRLTGSTDRIIDDGVSGRLFTVDDEAGLTAALREVLGHVAMGQAMGARARETVLTRYDIRQTADSWLSAYETVLSAPS